MRISTKVAPVKPTQSKVNTPIVQSIGYGFVEYRSENVVTGAIKHLWEKVINCHVLEFNASPNTFQQLLVKGTKLIVCKVPFQALRTELLQLFGSFGQINTVRRPKKGLIRGFPSCFCIFQIYIIEGSTNRCIKH